MKAIVVTFSVALMAVASTGCQHLQGHLTAHQQHRGCDCDACGGAGYDQFAGCDCGCAHPSACQCGGRHGGFCQKMAERWALHKAKHAPRTAGYAQPFGASGPMSAQVSYPYYTTRGPRDYLLANPPSIGR